MALNKNILSDALEDWMNNKEDYKEATDSIDAFADAYELYALDATAGGGALITYNKAGLINAMNNISPGLTPSEGAQLFANAIAAFWIGGIFATGNVISGISASVLKIAMQPTFEDINSSTTISTKASQLSLALDTSTRTIIITISGTPTPIT